MGWIADIFSKKANSTDIEKAESISAKKPKAWNINPHDSDYAISGLTDAGSWRTHPGTVGLDYYSLHSVARIPIIGAIIQTRIQQVAEFTSPQSNRYASGFRVRLRDSKLKMDHGAEKEARAIERMLMNAGGQYGIGGFEPTIRAMLRDSLTFDQCNFEVIRDRLGKVTGFLPVDAMTMRRARPKDAQRLRGQEFGQKYDFVQVMNDEIVAEFGKDEMGWGIRRPRTWVEVRGYGFPELEELLRVVTDLLNAQTWNSVNFTNGIHASTILALKSTMSGEVFTAFKRHITAMMMGVRNAQRMPIIQLSPEMNEDISAIKLNQSARDMEYSQWLNFLIKLTCAVYCMDPAELGFVFGNEGQNNALATGSPQARIISSKERGLRPILRSIQAWLNQWVVYEYNSDFCFEFVGIDEMSEPERVGLDIQTLKAYRTVNEVRAEHDLPPLDTDVANMVLDPTYINTALQEKMMAQQPEGGMGEPPEGGGGESPGGGGEEQPESVDGFASDDMGEDFNSSDIDELTQQLTASTVKAVGDGRILKKGSHTGKKRAHLIRERKGTRAYIIEVD